MRGFSFKKGLRIKIKEETYRFHSKFNDKGNETWQIERLSDHLLENRTSDELLRLYMEEDLHLDTDEVDETPNDRKHRRQREQTVISELPEHHQIHVTMMRRIILEVDRRIPAGMKTKCLPGSTESLLKVVLREVSTEFGRTTPVSQATYYRYRAKFADRGDSCDLIPRTNERGNRDQLNPQVKAWMLEELSKLLIGPRSRGIVNAMAAVKAKIEDAKQSDPHLELRLPTRKTFWKYWKKFPAYDRAVQKYGQTRARHMFRTVRGHEGPEACLDLVEFDETRTNFIVIDEFYQAVLGTPWFAWYLDVYSQLPIGFYLGFEPPGDIAITSALRHAMLPKNYVRTLYPDIRNSIPMMGRMREVTFDNGLSQHGRTVEMLSLDAEFDYKFTPVRTPWFKATVEGMFKILNQSLLQELPGFQPPPGTVLENYDPEKQGLISFSKLVYVIHKWLADLYLIKPHGELGLRPIDRWEEGTRLHPPELIGSKSDLEAVFGIVREGTLDHRGVVFENIRYHSDDLECLIRQLGELRLHGSRMDVYVKINYDNLGCVRVKDPVTGAWIRADARRTDYAEGLTLHRHLLYKKHAKDRNRPHDPDEWLLAHHEIQALVQQALPLNLGTGVNKAIARALGIGTHSMTTQMDVNGQFVAESPTAPPRLDFSMPFASPVAGRAAPASTASVPEPSRVIPKFDTDDSL